MMEKLSHWVAKRLQYVVSCCLCCFLAFISSMALATPRLEVSPEGIAFGEVPVGSNAVGRIELRNEGNAVVSVSRVKACCGAKAELSAMKIPPNGCECCQSPICCQYPIPIGHWQLDIQFNIGNISKGTFRALAFLR